MLGPLRYCTHLKLINHATLALNSNSLGQIIVNIASRVHYSNSSDENPCKGPCPPCICKDVAQTAGKRVEPWPKSDPPPAPWRAECPQEPQPPNYDPYRIKVPNIVVPPLPPSNAKRTGVVFTTTDQHGHGQDPGYHHQHHQGPPAYQQGAEQASNEDETKDASFLGLLKGFFGKFKGKQGKGDSEAMMNDNKELQWLRL